MNALSYPGCCISYENEKDITVKIPKFLQIIRSTVKPA